MTSSFDGSDIKDRGPATMKQRGERVSLREGETER